MIYSIVFSDTLSSCQCDLCSLVNLYTTTKTCMYDPSLTQTHVSPSNILSLMTCERVVLSSQIVLLHCALDSSSCHLPVTRAATIHTYMNIYLYVQSHKDLVYILCAIGVSAVAFGSTSTRRSSSLRRRKSMQTKNNRQMHSLHRI